MAWSLIVVVACANAAPQAANGNLVGSATFFGSEGEVRTSLLSVADTDEERARGLMGQTTLLPDGGMVFVFDGPTEDSFWMKDTLIPLSIAFWGEDDRIVGIMEMAPCRDDPCPTYRPDAPYTHALEMHRAWFTRHGIQIGDSVELQLATE